MTLVALAAVCLTWYIWIVIVCTIGYTRVFKWYSSPPAASESASRRSEEAPQVTIIRPIKGLDPGLYECLSSTFLQTYPAAKRTVHFCLDERSDPALAVVEKLVEDFPLLDAKIFIAAEDPRLRQDDEVFGPNPKIRQMSRGYREAKGDILWVIDCNVWVGKGVCGRMVDKLCGFGQDRPFKFVHQLPLVIETIPAHPSETTGLLSSSQNADFFAQVASTSTQRTEVRSHARQSSLLATIGGRLEEMFMSSSHAKFYTAINTVGVAPCIVGKSNAFRKSHLDALTGGEGMDYFSHNICEDHLIGDLLWKKPVPEAILAAAGSAVDEKWGNHGMVYGDLAIQPMAFMSLKEYVSRRVRWLRVRKYTVLLATLVEPGTESFLCSLYGAFAATTLPFFHEQLGIPQTWTAFALLWLLSVSIWCAVDWTLYRKLHSAESIEVDDNTPSFSRAQSPHRPLSSWLLAWVGREALAFPIWFTAFFLGATVVWRGKAFWVDTNMVVHEVKPKFLQTEARVNGDADRRKRRFD